MKKKIIISIFVILFLILVAGGGFFWWGNQKNVRELNKNLPEGVRVVKILIGNEYKVVNKIDGYEFKVPEEWNGISKINYIPERIEGGYKIASIGLQGKDGKARIVTVASYKIEKLNGDLELWAKTMFNTFGLIGEFSKDRVGDLEIVKTQENEHLFGMYVYFLKKNSQIYTITCGSEEFIRYIIANGKW